MATSAFGILTARTAVSIRCGSAGSWEGVVGGVVKFLPWAQLLPLPHPPGSPYSLLHSFDTVFFGPFPLPRAYTSSQNELSGAFVLR